MKMKLETRNAKASFYTFIQTTAHLSEVLREEFSCGNSDFHFRFMTPPRWCSGSGRVTATLL